MGRRAMIRAVRRKGREGKERWTKGKQGRNATPKAAWSARKPRPATSVMKDSDLVPPVPVSVLSRCRWTMSSARQSQCPALILYSSSMHPSRPWPNCHQRALLLAVSRRWVTRPRLVSCSPSSLHSRHHNCCVAQDRGDSPMTPCYP